MQARESVLSSEALGDARELSPIVQPGMSDSASLDNVLEFFVMSGLSLPHAMALMVPESFNDKNPISEDLKAFYEYHSILMEPWDGPAALLFSDGRYAGGMLDRNGLRPARYTITKGGVMVVASEVGVMDFDPSEIAEKGRLQPGKLLLIDTEEGRIYHDGEIKERLAAAHPYRQWLAANRIQLEKLHSGRRVENAVPDLTRHCLAFGFGAEDIDNTIMPMCVGGQEPTAAMGNDTPLAVLSDRPQPLFNYFRQQFAQVTNPAIDPIRESLVMSLTEYIGRVGSGDTKPRCFKLQDGAPAPPHSQQHPARHPVQHTLQGLQHSEATHALRVCKGRGRAARSHRLAVQGGGALRRCRLQLHHTLRQGHRQQARRHTLAAGRQRRAPLPHRGRQARADGTNRGERRDKGGHARRTAARLRRVGALPLHGVRSARRPRKAQESAGKLRDSRG